MGVFFIIASILVYCTFKKLRREKKKHRAMERVNQWTKKVIIMKPTIDNTVPGIAETLVSDSNAYL